MLRSPLAPPARPLRLYTHATVHTADAEGRAVLEEGAVAAWGGQLLWVGDARDARDEVARALGELEEAGLCDAGATLAAAEWTRCDGEHLAPGFIDAHVHLGLYPEGFVGEPKDLNELTSPLTPQLRALDGVWPGDVAFAKARAAGVTAVCVLPGSANVVGGVGVALRTVGSDVERMVLREPACLKVAFGYNVKHNHGGKGRAPLTRMAIADMMRGAFEGALAYEAKRLHDPEHPRDRAKEHLLLALRRELPVRAHASRADDILTAVRLAREFGLRLVIEHGYEAVEVLEQLKAARASVVYGPAFRTCGHSEDLHFSFAHAQRLMEAGLLVAQMTDHPIVPVQYLPLQAGLCVREGLDPAAALRLVTANAAEVLGLEGRVGRLRAGLDADFVRLSGPPLEVATRALGVYVEGARVV
ncbi:MAG: amidohydrolase family protein [Deltaproteobacteria bacterium]|nr:amidohydrolase family protein [Deltaproteobacteria bacterium]